MSENNNVIELYYKDVPYHERCNKGILRTKEGKRYDWGFVERDLSNGKEVHIKPVKA